MPFANWKFVHTPARFESIVSVDRQKLLIITSAFNDLDLVELHDKALKNFLRDPYDYFVVDNSTKENQSENIRAYCLRHGINYARLPFNVGNKRRDAGIAHGLALNWAYRNVVQRFRPLAFGFWDCDLFPTKPVKVSDYLAVSEAWGIVIKLRPYLMPWHYPAYLWIGLSFFRTERFKDWTPNFLPSFGVDTGGMVPLDEKITKAIPNLIDLYASPMIELAPGVRVRQCGDFVHFEGSSSGPSNALDMKKRWMENILRS